MHQLEMLGQQKLVKLSGEVDLVQGRRGRGESDVQQCYHAIAKRTDCHSHCGRRADTADRSQGASESSVSEQARPNGKHF